MKKQYTVASCLKWGELGQFADLREAWLKIGEVEGG